MKKFFNKLFCSGDWHIAISNHGIFQYIKNPDGYWMADPFLLKTKGSLYLFVEAFDKKKELGRIGYLNSQSNFTNLKIILSNNTHFSFPNIFVFNEKVFLLPENGEGGEVALYIFDAFPNGVHKLCTLLNGNYVDTALVFAKNDILYLISYDADKHKMLYLSFAYGSKDVEIIKTIDDKDRMLRPAGNSFFDGEMLYMPFQDCSEKYGAKIITKAICATESDLIFLEQKQVIDKDIFKGMRVDRIHTINRTSDGTFVVDYMKESFSILKPFKMLKRKIRRKNNRRKNR